MSETDRAVADARGTIARVRGTDALPVFPAARRRSSGLRTRLALIGGANLAILVAATVIGFILPLGMFGALAAMLAMLVVTLVLAFAPATPPPTPERLRTSDLKALPAQTGRWLDAQRPALPAPAITLVDQIGVRLDALAPQLATLDAGAPEAAEIRNLVGEQLPDFLRDYQAVPKGLRNVPRNGRTPDQQLADGLKLIEREIGELSVQLAQSDLDTLATRGRFLEIKYQGDDAAR